MILFTANWCGVCPAVKKWIDEEYNGVLDVRFVDIDKDEDGLVQKYKVKSLPTLHTGEHLVHGEHGIIEYLRTVQQDV